MGGTIRGDETRGGPPRGFRERRVASLFTEVLGIEVAAADADFFALGGDDAAAARLLDVIAEDAGVRLAEDAVVESRTVRALAARVAGSPITRQRRAIGFGTELAGEPLFCVMMAFQARALARAFNTSAGRPFYALQASGLEGRGPIDRSIGARARRAVQDIRALQPAGPYFLAGYSGDSFVAFEVARLLLEAGETVELFAVIDMWAPVFSWAYVARLCCEGQWRSVCEWNPQRGPCFDARRRAMSARATATEVARRIRWRMLGRTAGLVRRKATPQGKLFHELTRTAISGHRPVPLEIDAFVIRADDFGGWDWTQRRLEPDMSWHRVAKGRIDVVHVAGNHMTILEGRYASGLADALAGAVQRGNVLPDPATVA